MPLLMPREGVPPVVATAAALRETVERFAAGTGPTAVDAERASGYRYSQRAYLVQLRRAGAGTALIDPIACPDLSELSARSAGRRLGAARRGAGPAVPCRGGHGALLAVRYRACRQARRLRASGTRRDGRQRAGTAAGKGPFGRRLVHAAAAAGLARLRRARCGGAARAARRAAGRAGAAGQARPRDRGVRSGAARAGAGSPGRTVAAYLRHPPGAQPQEPRGGAGDVAGARCDGAAARHRARTHPSRRGDPCRGHRVSRDPRRAARAARLSRPSDPAARRHLVRRVACGRRPTRGPAADSRRDR